MKEKAAPLFFGAEKIKNVEGRIRIELTSTKTGAKKIIEQKNTFQSAVLSKYLRSLGSYNNSPFANSTWAGRRLWRNLTGGIFLFRDEIQAPAEYMPAGNAMVANGAFGISNAGAPAELGSYNAIESSTSGNNSVSFVYDWGTSQGNGSISCVCLTSEAGGLIGYGNASGGMYGTPIDLAVNQNGTQDLTGIPYKNKIYTFSRNGSAKTVTITKTKKAIDIASIFDSQESETETKAYTTNIPGNGILVNYMSGGKFVLIPYKESSWDNTVSAGASFVALVYDAEAKTLTEKTITNNSSNALFFMGFTNIQKLAVAAEGKIIAPTATSATSWGSPLNVIDINGGTAEEIPSAAAPLLTRGGCASIAPGLLYVRNNTTSKLYIYDTVNGTAYPTNGTLNVGGAGVFRIYHDQVDALYTDIDNGGYFYKNPLYLATISNLDNPVTKDSTQTMKVIYTLTEASA